MRKAIIFDRDGTINYRPIGEYVKTIEEFAFIPDFFDCFQYIKDLGYIAILATNQQGIGKGLMDKTDLLKIHNYMQSELLKNTGYDFDGIYFCPDLKDSGSFRRKPNPGMIYEAITDFKLSPSHSIMIGDSVNDSIAGNAAGLTTILVGNDVRAADADYVFTNLFSLKNNFKKIVRK